jgi:amino acid transporter
LLCCSGAAFGSALPHSNHQPAEIARTDGPCRRGARHEHRFQAVGTRHRTGGARPVSPWWRPVIIALQSSIYTYDGWTGPIYFGEELRDPARDIPRAMIGGVLLVLVIYLLLNAAFLRAVPIQDMRGDPFVAATAAARLFGPTGDMVIRIVMLLSLDRGRQCAAVDGAREYRSR